MEPQRFFTPQELCDRWRGTVTVGTLANWRVAGSETKGPTYTKRGRRVLYDLTDIEAYEVACRSGNPTE